MEQPANIDRLREALQISSLHLQRMTYAKTEVKKHFPLTIKEYNKLGEKEFSLLDQYIFRFSKLQDIMGNKLFPVLLENLGEDISSKPFIDILLILERLNLLENHKDWLALRETRNLITHEYPFAVEETVDGLNTLNEDSSQLITILERITSFTNARFNI